MQRHDMQVDNDLIKSVSKASPQVVGHCDRRVASRQSFISIPHHLIVGCASTVTPGKEKKDGIEARVQRNLEKHFSFTSTGSWALDTKLTSPLDSQQIPGR